MSEKSIVQQVVNEALRGKKTLNKKETTYESKPEEEKYSSQE